MNASTLDYSAITTLDLMQGSLLIDSETTIETTGFSSVGDGGGAEWRLTGNVISPSQSPDDTGGATLSDSNGNEYQLIVDGVINVNKLNSVIAAYNTAKSMASALGSQEADDNAIAIYFPAGVHNKNGELIDLKIGATGLDIFGDGYSSKLHNIQITMDGAARCNIRNFMMTGPLGYGINSNKNGSSKLSRQNNFNSIYIKGKETGVIFDGSTWNVWDSITVEKSQGNGWWAKESSGEIIDGCFSYSNTGKGVRMEKCGELKISGMSCHNNVGYGVHLVGTDLKQCIENYFVNLTSTIQQRTRLIDIVDIRNFNGKSLITTVTAHELTENLDDLNVSGTDDHNGKCTVISIESPTSLVVSTSFSKFETGGSIDLPNWDLVIESDSAVNHRVNDIFIEGGNSNYTKVNNSFNVTFINTRLKNQFWVGAGSNMVFRHGSARGRQASSFDDIHPSGDGQDGLLQDIMSNNSGDSVSNDVKLSRLVGGQRLCVDRHGVSVSSLLTGRSGLMQNNTSISFKPAFETGVIKISNGEGDNKYCAELTYNTRNAYITPAGYRGQFIDIGSGQLNGSTGTPNKVTISADHSGNIWIENRVSNNNFYWTIFR